MCNATTLPYSVCMASLHVGVVSDLTVLCRLSFLAKDEISLSFCDGVKSLVALKPQLICKNLASLDCYRNPYKFFVSRYNQHVALKGLDKFVEKKDVVFKHSTVCHPSPIPFNSWLQL